MYTMTNNAKGLNSHAKMRMSQRQGDIDSKVRDHVERFLRHIDEQIGIAANKGVMKHTEVFRVDGTMLSEHDGFQAQLIKIGNDIRRTLTQLPCGFKCEFGVSEVGNDFYDLSVDIDWSLPASVTTDI